MCWGCSTQKSHKTRYIQALAFRNARKTRDATIWGSEVPECLERTRCFTDRVIRSTHIRNAMLWEYSNQKLLHNAAHWGTMMHSEALAKYEYLMISYSEWFVKQNAGGSSIHECTQNAGPHWSCTSNGKSCGMLCLGNLPLRQHRTTWHAEAVVFKRSSKMWISSRSITFRFHYKTLHLRLCAFMNTHSVMTWSACDNTCREKQSPPSVNIAKRTTFAFRRPQTSNQRVSSMI